MYHAYQKPLIGNRIGVVFGSFAPLHQGHLDLIMRAKKENDGGALVICCGYDGDKGEPLMPHLCYGNHGQLADQHRLQSGVS